MSEVEDVRIACNVLICGWIPQAKQVLTKMDYGFGSAVR